MTISQETLPFLFDGIKFCSDSGFKIDCNLAYGIDWNNSNNTRILELELNKLINYYLSNNNVEICSLLKNRIDGLACIDNHNSIRKWCGAGTHMHTYDVEGNEYPCQFFMPLSAGPEKAILAKNIEFFNEIPVRKLDIKCQNCVVKSICPTCYGSNYIGSGNIYIKDYNYCELMKVIFKVRAYFQAKRWENNQLNLTQAEELSLLESIMLIQKEL